MNPIKKYIDEHCETQNEFAEGTGADPASVNEWYWGKKNPSEKYWPAIIKFTGEKVNRDIWFTWRTDEVAQAGGHI